MKARARRFAKSESTWLLVQVFGLLTAALVLRASVFGNPNPLADDAFYFLVGQRMHDGALPYVDVWDRKPPGLFVLYWAIAGASRDVIAYQLAATLFAALTALVIAAMVDSWTGGRRGGMLAGLAYLAMLGPLDGFSGQSPVFYNLPMALAALLAWQAGNGRGGEWRCWLAMALCGLALTIKQTSLFESAFLACWLLWRLRAGGMAWPALAGRALGFAAVGAAPFAAFALAYWWLGHFSEFWQAIVLSNLAKAPLAAGELNRDMAAMAVRLAVPVAVAGWGVWQARSARPSPRGFVLAWLGAGLVGVASVPHFFPHYALPWLVPLSAAAGLGFARERGGLVAFALVAVNGFAWYDPFDRGWNLHAIASTRALASAVVQHDHGRGLFVYDGPLQLYAMTDRRFMSPLVFTHHLNQAIERNVSHLDTDAEVDRVLARHPGAVVTVLSPRNFPVNRHTWNAVEGYVRANCRRVALVPSYDHMTITPTAVYGDCAPGPDAKPDRIDR